MSKTAVKKIFRVKRKVSSTQHWIKDNEISDREESKLSTNMLEKNCVCMCVCVLESTWTVRKAPALPMHPRTPANFLLPKSQGGTRWTKWSQRRQCGQSPPSQHVAMEAADSFQRQSAYPLEEPKCYSGGSHTREINLLFRITALVISMINTLVNVSRQNCDSLWFFSKETRILMNAKQNYNGGRREP